jgi:hypothetical protein
MNFTTFGAAIVLALASADAAAQWTPCAREDGFCKFEGRKEVAYGAGDKWVSKVFTGGIKCSNVNFGDPAPGVAKTCRVRDGGVGATSSVPIQWVACANEGGVCRFSGRREVAFGAGERWTTKVFIDGVNCSTAKFGDPAPRVAKSCRVKAAVGEDPNAQVTSAWVRCANEGQTCQFSGERRVGYGGGGRYKYRVLKNGARCNNETFGDPAPGVAKACFYNPD